MKIILASNNKNKMREFRELLAGTDAEPISQRDAGCDFEVDETGTTFEENAFLKADAVLKVTGCIAVADDSGLVVDALNGEPGIYSARYGFGHDASDADRNRYLLGKLGDEKNRRARDPENGFADVCFHIPCISFEKILFFQSYCTILFAVMLLHMQHFDREQREKHEKYGGYGGTAGKLPVICGF